MKKIIYASAIALATLILISCDALLDVKPQTDMTDANFWNTEQDLRAAVSRLYTQLPALGHDARADDKFGRDPDPISTGQRVTPVTSGGDWTDPYRRIFQANNIIEKAPRASVSERVMNRHIAEAHFFRAWEYFNLVTRYGDVPLVLRTFTNTQDPDLKMGRTPREVVIQQCYEDLLFAARWLPTRAELIASPDNSHEFHRRRVTQSSALGLMVRIGLHEGTMRKFHQLSSDWQAHLDVSIAAFERLRDEPGHGHDLYRGEGHRAFLGAFLEERNVENPEIMFGKALGFNGAAAGSAGNIFTDFSGLASGRFGFTRAMVDMFLYADGLPGSKSAYYLPAADETSFNSVFGYETNGVTPNGHPRDPRLTQTFWRINDPDDRTEVVVAGFGIGWQHRQGENYNFFITSTREPPGYRLKKMFWGAQVNRDWADKTYIRWGEMLIAYAEALYERNGAITDAQLDATINALRARVGFNVRLTNAFVATHSLNMQEEIRRERTVELIGESQRYNDIIRWKIAEYVLPRPFVSIRYFDHEAGIPITAQQRAERLTLADGTLDGVLFYPSGDMYIQEKGDARRFNPARDYFYPIPTNEIAKSDNNIKQNPNWD
jgi:hypothetical protein